MGKKIINRNNAIGLFFALLSLYVIFSTFSSMSIWEQSVPEEGFLPFFLGCILLGLSLILMSDGFRKEKGKMLGEGKESGDIGKRINRRKVALYFIAIWFYSLTFGLLGFLLSTEISLIFILKWIERESWKMTLLIAFGSSIISYLLFDQLLGVILPLGPLERWKYIFRG